MLASAAAVPALAEPSVDVDGIAKALSAKPQQPDPGACADKLPDGTCPDTIETRQLLIGKSGAGNATIRRIAMVKPQPVRADIRMSFEKGSAELTPQAKTTLDRLAVALKSRSDYRPFEIDGHTDKSGSREMNVALSQARAQSVVDYLAGKGVDVARMKAVGYGYDRPLPGMAADRAANRRVELAAF